MNTHMRYVWIISCLLCLLGNQLEYCCCPLSSSVLTWVYIRSISRTSGKTFIFSYFFPSFIVKREQLVTTDQFGDVGEVLRLMAQFCFCSDFWILFGSPPVSLQSHLALCRGDSRAWRCWPTPADGLVFTHALPKEAQVLSRLRKKGLSQDSTLVFRGFYFLSVWHWESNSEFCTL